MQSEYAEHSGGFKADSQEVFRPWQKALRRVDGGRCPTVSLSPPRLTTILTVTAYFELKALQRHVGVELWMAIVDLTASDFRK